MNNINFFKLFIAYIKRNIKAILLFFIFSIIFTFIFYLSDLPFEIVSYAALLCFAISIIFASFDFLHFYRKDKQLNELLANATISMDKIPSPDDLIEANYIEVLKALQIEKTKIASAADIAIQDMVDYYTLWAHQIKTPIAAMRLILQSEESEFSYDLSIELFKIEQYVEMMLNYIRLHSGSTDFVLKSYDLDNIIKNAVRKYAKVFIGKKVSLDYLSVDYNVLTDEKWLGFVIEQILSNALKYTNKGKISIYMSDNKTLIIEDTGIGIACEDLPRVFEKGFTGYNGRLDKKSTGIGLYLCKKILNKLSHTINIESEIGKGTKVIIGLDSLNILVE